MVLREGATQALTGSTAAWDKLPKPHLTLAWLWGGREFAPAPSYHLLDPGKRARRAVRPLQPSDGTIVWATQTDACLSLVTLGRSLGEGLWASDHGPWSPLL